ncbi:hypothetical protein COY54_01110, partial [Candidatus Falkowbacteria bacterium CG_4_10_14_0_8_um_filter_41_36]
MGLSFLSLETKAGLLFKETRQWQIASDAFEDLHADGAGTSNTWTDVTQANLATNDNDTTKAYTTNKNNSMYATII